MVYYQYKITVNPELKEIILGFLSRLPCESFEEIDTGWHAYVQDNIVYKEEVEQYLAHLKDHYQLDWSVELFPDRNWNALWESNFDPIKIGTFCGIRADFHPPVPNVTYELVINPKMSFGTGHHETTFMMIQLMEALYFEESKVLDFGCGTGVLALLAKKMGAARVEAIDIEQSAFDNTLENASANGVDDLHVFLGDINVVEETEFDFVLANINRNVILDSLSTLYDKIKVGGYLLVSGILRVDAEKVLATAFESGFESERLQERGEWVALRFIKKEISSSADT